MFTWKSLEETSSRAVGVMSSLGIQDSNLLADGLTKLFAEIKSKDKIEDLSVEYQKFAEWLRIE